MSYTLGISAFYHDSSATLIKNGNIVSAAQEERFTRIKHDSAFPYNAIKFILNNSRIKLNDINYIVFHEKPFLKFERLLETYLAFAPRGFTSFCKSMPLWIKEKVFQKKIIIKNLKKIDHNFNQHKLKFSEHHLSHAASAYFPSPFSNALILTLDGVGEWTTTSLWMGNENKLTKLKEINFPHSLGLLYSAFTYYLGFKVNSGEYKVMGLAPYGKPIYTNLIRENLVFINEDGSFKLNMNYFEFATGLKMTNKKFDNLFDLEKRTSETELTQKHMDIASSIQNITEEIILRICDNLKKEYKTKNLCLAGGVALNCVANGKILKKKIFDNIWIQPASGDAGCSLGAALAHEYLIEKKQLRKKDLIKDNMQGSYLGPKYSNQEIENELNNLGAKFNYFEDEQLYEQIADQISQGQSVGWFQGKMEFGPRALGNRSILADPRNPNMQKNLNLKIKFRESFRPFAPAILEEKLSEFFDIKTASPYMLLVADIKKKYRKNDLEIENLKGLDLLNFPKSTIPAITHVDFSARIQTVNKDINPKFYNLINAFYKKTDCPILINTSFNIRGEPIVCTTTDAFNCFMGTDLDILVCENYVLYKKQQNSKLKLDYRSKFKLD